MKKVTLNGFTNQPATDRFDFTGLFSKDKFRKDVLFHDFDREKLIREKRTAFNAVLDKEIEYEVFVIDGNDISAMFFSDGTIYDCGRGYRDYSIFNNDTVGNTIVDLYLKPFIKDHFLQLN